MIPWLLLLLLILVYSIALPSIFKRAGKAAWMGAIPIVNLFFLIKLLKRPWYWVILLFAPGVNILVLIILNVELGISFNQRSVSDQWKFGALPWYALIELAFKNKEAKHIGPRDWTGKKKSWGREWGEAILFAIIAASVIRTFVFEAFTIPTPSMEGSMLVGDYLFVSKISYGPKSPQTPISLPFVHNNMPGSMTPSYVDWFSMPYFRLPGLGDVERNDPVVFNFPPGDSIIIDPKWSTFDFYQKRRNDAIQSAGGVTGFLENEANYLKRQQKSLENQYGLRQRPLDKREHYIKRCVGLPGDKLAIVDGEIIINDEAVETPSEVQFMYRYTLKNAGFQSKMEEKLGLTKLDIAGNQGKEGVAAFTAGELVQLEAMNILDTIFRLPHDYQQGDLNIFPNSPLEPYSTWDIDNFGPVLLPARGLNIPLTTQNIEMYERAISHFEGHDLKVEGDQIFIDGELVDSYTFSLNYYWLMGDNRHNSLDSRFWGFVPETHVVGKAVFTWFSLANETDQGAGNGGIRWNRMFRTVK